MSVRDVLYAVSITYFKIFDKSKSKYTVFDFKITIFAINLIINS